VCPEWSLPPCVIQVPRGGGGMTSGPHHCFACLHAAQLAERLDALTQRRDQCRALQMLRSAEALEVLRQATQSELHIVRRRCAGERKSAAGL
jgi:hypothetical protein